MSTVIVTGGRDFDDDELLWRVLNTLHQEQPITVLVHGDAKGADAMAKQWAESRMPHVHTRSYPAEWGKHGRAAGPLRNQKMIDDERAAGPVRCVVAFPGGRGTADCVRRAEAAGLTVIAAARNGAGVYIERAP